MSGVVNHLQTISVCNRLNTRGVARGTIDMNRDNCGGAWGYCGFDFGRVEIAGNWIYINKNGLYAVPEQCMCCCDEAIWGRDDFARDAQGLQGRYQCQGSIREQRKILHTQVFAQSCFEPLMKWTTIGQL